MKLLRLIVSIIIVSVATWLILMPIYGWIDQNLGNAPELCIILGLVMIIFSVKYLKLRF